MLMRGRYVLTDAGLGPEGILEDGAIHIADGTIDAVGSFAQLRQAHPDDDVLGNGRQLLMPGLIDAHCHGRGLTPVQKGVLHDYLENALLDWAFMPVVDPEIQASLCALRHLRNGATTIHHNGFDDEGPDAPARLGRHIDAYLRSGIRLAFSPGVRNTNKLTLDEPGFLASLPTDMRALAQPFASYDGEKIAADFFDLFDHLHQRYASAETRVFLGPSWVQGSTASFLTRVKEKSDALGGIPIHIHTLQTPQQKAYGLRHYNKSLVAYLEDLGLLDRNLVMGHAIWVTQDDIERIARRDAAITTHPSCNLNMRNGLAPIVEMRRAGICIAMGMDDKTINDDEDAVMELRMLHKLHRVADFDLRSRPLSAYEVIGMGTLNAARVCGFEGELGALAPGMKADAILVDLDEVLEEPWLDPDLDIAEAFLHRASGRHVNTAVVGGRVAMADRAMTMIDVPALYAEARKQLAKGLSPAQEARARTLRALKPYYQQWYAAFETEGRDPFYVWNSRL